MNEVLTMVDEKDNELGKVDREKAHSGQGIRHRAFVVFLFKDDMLLIQRRSMKKKLWPGYWDVSYTSHVYPGETYVQAAMRKSLQELGVKVDNLKEVLSFVYWAGYDDNSENEFCKLLVGKLSQEPNPNPDEVMEIRLGRIRDISRETLLNPEIFTPWFKISLSKYLALNKA